jgi:glycerol dehydrogenase-like iron-containing ADH family enzyme
MADNKRFDKIDAKLEKIVEHIGSIDVTLAKQSVLLDEHIKRSNMLEEKLAPVEKHVTIVNTILKVLGAAGATGGAAHGVLHYLMKIY